MRYQAAFLLLLTIGALTGCANAQPPQAVEIATSKPGQKILIVYLSRTSNTKAVAEFIQDEVGGTMVPIELEKPYPADYRTTVEQVAKENESGFLPPLKTKIDRIEQYDTVFVGFPTWGMQLPPPIKSFLRTYDLKGKTVIPFNTNGGYGEGSTISTLTTLCTGCTVLDGFTTKGGVERDGVLLAIKDARAAEVRSEVTNWLRRIKILSKWEKGRHDENK
jgi:flavodoxin